MGDEAQVDQSRGVYEEIRQQASPMFRFGWTSENLRGLVKTSWTKHEVRVTLQAVFEFSANMTRARSIGSWVAFELSRGGLS